MVPNTSLLGDWPSGPWNFIQEVYQFQFDQYGREEDELDKSLRPEIVAGNKSLREYFLSRTITKNAVLIYLAAGIINFSIGFTSRQLWLGMEVSLRAFEVEFKKLESIRASHLRPVTAARPWKLSGRGAGGAQIRQSRSW